MDSEDKITVQATINSPIEKVWEFYNAPEHVISWNNASDDWHTPKAENNLEVGQRFTYRMEAIDESAGFDFGGMYEEIEQNKFISYIMDDGRKVEITFTENNDETQITIKFDPEKENSKEMQKDGWQSILNNFKKYVEEN